MGRSLPTPIPETKSMYFFPSSSTTIHWAAGEPTASKGDALKSRRDGFCFLKDPLSRSLAPRPGDLGGPRFGFFCATDGIENLLRKNIGQWPPRPPRKRAGGLALMSMTELTRLAPPAFRRKSRDPRLPRQRTPPAKLLRETITHRSDPGIEPPKPCLRRLPDAIQLYQVALDMSCSTACDTPGSESS